MELKTDDVSVVPRVSLIAIAWLAIQAACFGQQTHSLVDEIVTVFKNIEKASEELTTVAHVSYDRLWKRDFSPALKLKVDYQSLGSEVRLVEIGFDRRKILRAPSDTIRIVRTYGLDGIERSSESATQATELRDLGYKDPRQRFSTCEPNEYLWSFRGVYRSSLLSRAKPKIMRTEGTTPKRVVMLRIEKSHGRIDFRCREDWGWLAEKVEAFDHSGNSDYQVVVHDVHLTRLLPFPSRCSFKVGSSSGEISAQGRITFEEPRFVGAAHSADGPGEVVPYVYGSFLEHEFTAGRIAALDKAYDSFIAAIDDAAISKSRGRRSQRKTLRWFLFAIAIVSISTAPLLRLRRRKGTRLLIVAALVAAVGSAATRLSFIRQQPYESFENVWATVTPIPDQLKSKSLCALDCLGVVERLSGGERSDFDLLRGLLQPGIAGADMESIAVTAECLGFKPKLIDILDYKQGPSPIICHVPNHFFVYFRGANRDFVFDPAVGFRAADWNDITSLASRRALWLIG